MGNALFLNYIEPPIVFFNWLKEIFKLFFFNFCDLDSIYAYLVDEFSN